MNIAKQVLQVYDMQENHYQQFEESLKQDDDEDDSKENSKSIKSSNKKDDSKHEIRVGIKDWYTKKIKKMFNLFLSFSFTCPRQEIMNIVHIAVFYAHLVVYCFLI